MFVNLVRSIVPSLSLQLAFLAKLNYTKVSTKQFLVNLNDYYTSGLNLIIATKVTNFL
jgi:hypothetical protein